MTQLEHVVLHILAREKYLLSRVLVTNNAGSGMDEQIYLLLIHTTSNNT
jgi:hypothetical protein